MHFSRILAAVGAAASLLTSSVDAGAVIQKRSLTAQQIVENINVLTAKSQALQGPANSITIINGPLIAVGMGPFPKIISGFNDIIATVTADVAQMQGTQPFSVESDETAIFNAFREFVRVHQVLLNILIGKAGLFNTVPFIGQPVAAVLRQLESIVDTIGLGLADLLEHMGGELAGQLSSLDGTIQVAINSYDGLSLS